MQISINSGKDVRQAPLSDVEVSIHTDKLTHIPVPHIVAGLAALFDRQELAALLTIEPHGSKYLATHLHELSKSTILDSTQLLVIPTLLEDHSNLEGVDFWAKERLNKVKVTLVDALLILEFGATRGTHSQAILRIIMDINLEKNFLNLNNPRVMLHGRSASVLSIAEVFAIGDVWEHSRSNNAPTSYTECVHQAAKFAQYDLTAGAGY